jgi:hypothetical protein
MVSPVLGSNCMRACYLLLGQWRPRVMRLLLLLFVWLATNFGLWYPALVFEADADCNSMTGQLVAQQIAFKRASCSSWHKPWLAVLLLHEQL